MKNILFLFFLIVFPIISFSQEMYDFTGLQGIKTSNEDVYFEFRGYEIYTTSVPADLNTVTSNEILSRKIQLGEISADYNEAVGNAYCRIVESEIPLEYGIEENLHQALYFANKLGGEVQVVQFKTYNQRDFEVERAFVHAFFEKQLDSFISDSWYASTIDFVGQKIQLGYECVWTKPHKVTCGDTQISWSEFLTKEEAVWDIDNRIRIYDSTLFSIVEESDIEVLFEGIPTIARRVVFRNMKNNGAPYQIYYYLAQGIGGRYVSCVLQNPAYNQKEYGLAPLLQQVMSIPNLPHDAYIVNESNETDNVDGQDQFAPVLEVQASSWVPLGQLKDVFGYAPTIGLVLQFPVKHQLSVDLGIQLGPPLKKGKFDYRMGGSYYETESDFLFNLSLRCRKSKDFSKHCRLSTYLGLGVNGLQTDVESWDYDDEENKIETISTVDVFGGVSLRYKKMSVFAEYHYTPYNIANKVKSNFGHSALNIGLSYSFVWR